MNKYRFILEPYNGSHSRYMCPKCRHRFNTFKRYVDTEREEYLADHVGRCDREESCGFHYTPREYFKANPSVNRPINKPMQKMQAETVKYDTIPQSVFLSTLRGYDENIFSWFLAEMFGAEDAIALIEKYHIGTAKHWPGATIFWQIDAAGRIRTGKIMLYDATNCKRVKYPYNHIAWAHNLLTQKHGGAIRNVKNSETDNPNSEFNLKQCFFGEHLLHLEPLKIVAITESEKTAVIASYYYPNYIWLAAGSLQGLSADKCKVLKNRRVILYPDINGYQKWTSKANELNARIPTATFTVDYGLMQNVNPGDRERGIDIADPFIDTKLYEWELEREWE